jgi:DNA recombination protein Rad52
MGFTGTQTRQLRAKLDGRHVRSRNANGCTLHYVEGWHVVSEANRIFGFAGWDRRTLTTACVWTGMRSGSHSAAYTATVRVSVRAGHALVVREGSGTGEANAPTIGQAHERALKGAETDATKRALATFGNPFGLALYDREQTRVRHYPSKPRTDQVANGPWVLRSSAGEPTTTFDNSDGFCNALRQAMTNAESIELLFAVWEQNLATVRSLSYSLKQNGKLKADFGKSLVAHLKSCAIALVNPEPEPAQDETEVMTGKVRAGCEKNSSTAASEK